ncbi:DNA-directed RNA polymerase III subunit RPC3 [Plasmodiophora brassicae]
MDDRVEIPTLQARPYERFLTRIVDDYLGSVCASVVKVFHKSGPLPLPLIGRDCQPALQSAHVKSALKSLIQHGMVTSSPTGPKGASLFELDEREICLRIRVPKYVAFVGNLIGVEAEVALELLGEHGRLTVHDLIERFRTSQQDASAKGEQRFLQCLQSLCDQRFLVQVDLPSEDGDHGKEPAAPSTKLAPPQNEFNVDENPDAVVKINHERFTFAFRNELIVEYVSGRLDPVAGEIVRVMLLPRDCGSAPVNLTDRYEYSEMSIFDNLPEVPAVSRAQLRQYLHEMMYDNVPIIELKESISSGEVYVVRVDAIVGELRRRHTQSIVRAKFGDEAGRIFMLLLDKKQLESKSVSDLALVSKKQTREKLYKMLEQDFVHLQELAKSADRNPQRTLYIWSVPLNKVYAQLRSAFMFAWVNLRERLKRETEEAQPVIDHLRYSGAGASSLSEADQKVYETWAKRSERLENAMLRVDDDILLFRDL